MRYFPKPPGYGVLNPTAWWGYPISPTHPLRQAYNQIWFGAIAPRWLAATTRQVRNGRGILFHYVGLANADAPITITHRLGRIPAAIYSLSTTSGQVYPPRVRFTTQPTTQTATISFDQSVTDQWVQIV